MKSTICLNLIVKDEVSILEELFSQVASFIDYWVIVDTGSTDGTQEFIKSWFKERNIPGELYERPWVDFGFNRTEALQLAMGKAVYTWVIDADDRIVGSFPDLSNLTADCYYLKFNDDGFLYWRQQIFKSCLDWQYIGVVHEYPYSKNSRDGRKFKKLKGNYHLVSGHFGARSKDPDKFRKDAELLSKAVEKEPRNERNWFYLGQSWFDAKEYELAEKAYEKRVSLNGWDEEIFYSLYKIGLCAIQLHKPDKDIFEALVRAYSFRITRAEPLYIACLYFRHLKQYKLAYGLIKIANTIPFPKDDVLFIDKDLYEYKILDELSILAFHNNEKEESLKYFEQLLSKNIREEDKVRIQINFEKVKNS